MDLDEIAIAVIAVLALVLIVYYVIAHFRERGQNPHLAREVYLYYNAASPRPDAPRVAKAHGAAVATQGQVAAYAAVGGSCHGAGLVAGGALVELTPAGRGVLVATPHTLGAAPVGVWLYGPKPRRGAPHIESFSCVHWFQPPGSAPRVFK